MAATSGKAAWDKHYKNNMPNQGVLVTTTFNGTKCGPLYSAVDGKSVSDRAIGGTQVEVLDQKWTDDAKKTILIRIKDTKKEYRVNIDHLIKPKTGSRTITNKALSPKGLNLTVGSNVIKKSEYIRKVTAAVKAISTDIIDDNIKDFMLELLVASENSTGRLTKGTSITNSDIGVIAKDFGEVTGAWYYIHTNYGNFDPNEIPNDAGDSIEFPTAANQRLIDYYVYDSTTNLRFPVSAKAGVGAAPSLVSVWELIRNDRPKGRDDQKVWEFLEIVAGRKSENRSISVLESVLEGAKKYNSKGYQIIKEAIFNNRDYSVQDIQNWAEQFKDGKSVHEYLQRTFYSKLPTPRTSDVTMISNVLARNKSDGMSSKTTKTGIILSPMGYSLMDELNSNEKYTKYLTRVVNSLSINQVNLRLSKDRFDYTTTKFGLPTNFIFDFHNNAGDPAANAFGFKKKN
jgi:hypothetical protein